ncbi:MAG TPA: Hsp20/alpha crystallin family protein [Vicinamibacterales bacterium]|nr:Hsp20/alpha crystallin family protein [Vicinamibacterales bacterium]
MLQKKSLARRTPSTPFGLLRQMTAELDRMFEEPWALAPAAWFPETTIWAPKVDVFEKDNRLITRVDLPGLKKEDVKVEVENGYLTLSGERKFEATQEKENIYRAEREYGSFYRAVPLPEGVKVEEIKATFDNGVLEVAMPLPPAVVENKARRIEVKDAALPPTTVAA